ncbi:MAG TPA: exosortase/archaeosortase family protein [Phycisphaerae bacterium]|nr:exosortase/archaeosortase family protein [Phycisphaerae bacterium]
MSALTGAGAGRMRGDERRSRRAPDNLPTWREYLGLAGVAKVLLLAALLGWLYSAHFYRLFVYWMQPDWSHGFLIPLFSLYLVHCKRAELMTGEHEGSLWGALLMLISVAAYVFCIMSSIGYPQPLTIITMIAGVVLLVRGWRTLWLTLFPIGFLVLAIPPPERLYRAVTQPLQQAAAAIAALVLNTFPGAEVERQGINIAFFMKGGRSGDFTVAGACSGMRSLMAFVALGLAMAYFTPRPPWHRVAMAVLVVPVALFCNILRVIITGGLQMYGYPELASGTPHTILGLVLFGLGFAMYLGVLWVLDHLFTEEPDEPEQPDAARAGESP